jgi:poly-gamma-glutamate synthesis protein (capsule biosynthesis protein)
MPISKNAIVIAAVGDIMMPASIQSAAARYKNDYNILFDKITSDLAGADIILANLETPVDHTSRMSGYPKFNAHPGLLGALKKTGVKVVSLANNHAMDAGFEGLKKTIDNIESAGLVFIGAGRTKAEAAEIKFLKVRDVLVAFLAYTYGTNERLPRKALNAPGVNVIGIESEQDLNRAAASVRRARAVAHLVVVSVHWGEEYVTKPTVWQRRVAEHLVEAGADIILGHHPHVLQPIESMPASDGRIGLVAFSLGNFISSQNARITFANKSHQQALTGDGIVLNITAVKKGDGVRVDHAEFLPIWTLREVAHQGIVYRPVSLARQITALEDKQKKSQADIDLIDLLNYRQNFIIRTVSKLN